MLLRILPGSSMKHNQSGLLAVLHSIIECSMHKHWAPRAPICRSQLQGVCSRLRLLVHVGQVALAAAITELT